MWFVSKANLYSSLDIDIFLFNFQIRASFQRQIQDCHKHLNFSVNYFCKVFSLRCLKEFQTYICFTYTLNKTLTYMTKFALLLAKIFSHCKIIKTSQKKSSGKKIYHETTKVSGEREIFFFVTVLCIFRIIMYFIFLWLSVHILQAMSNDVKCLHLQKKCIHLVNVYFLVYVYI